MTTCVPDQTHNNLHHKVFPLQLAKPYKLQRASSDLVATSALFEAQWITACVIRSSFCNKCNEQQLASSGLSFVTIVYLSLLVTLNRADGLLAVNNINKTIHQKEQWKKIPAQYQRQTKLPIKQYWSLLFFLHRIILPAVDDIIWNSYSVSHTSTDTLQT